MPVVASVFKNTDDGVLVFLRVTPNASANKIQQLTDVQSGYTDADGQLRLKIFVTACPQEGKANKAVIQLLAKTFKIPKSTMQIIAGQTNKNKTVLIQQATKEKLQKCCVSQL